MKRVKAWIRKRKVNCAAKAGENRLNKENERTHTERMGDFVSFSSLLDMEEGKKNQFGKKVVGKFNSVFIAASVCIGSNYYQHASRTSNNTIPLLMTKMKWNLVNIIQFHPCSVCSKLQ